MPPDLIVIGDSHSNALLDGCAAHGIRAEMLRFSGNLWHAGDVRIHAEHGLWIDRPKRLQDQIIDLREKLGGASVLSPAVPVLATLGFHLGRIVPPFGLLGHVSEARHVEADAQTLYVSQGFVDAYIGAFRGPHVRLARRMAQLAPTVFVAPPLCIDPRNMRVFHASILNRMRRVGLTVHDPTEDLCPTGSVLDPAYVTADGVHGNAAYGARVIGRMIELGLIARPGGGADGTGIGDRSLGRDRGGVDAIPEGAGGRGHGSVPAG